MVESDRLCRSGLGQVGCGPVVGPGKLIEENCLCKSRGW